LKDIRQKIGLVFQYPEYQLFEMTVFDDVSFGPKNMKLNEDEISERVKYALSLTGVSDELYECSPFELSGGQKRRVAIAGVLAMKPDVLVLDEPMAGLDPSGREEILAVLDRLNKEENITMILVSHSADDVARFADRVLVMSDGKKLCFDTPKKVFTNKEVIEKSGISVPSVNEIFLRLNSEKNINLPDDVFTPEEAEKVLLKGIV
jgi:energy-coupling factor transport system ATP-binding protein